MPHPGADQDVYVVDSPGAADAKVFVINNEIAGIVANNGYVLIYEGGWTARALTSSDLTDVTAFIRTLLDDIDAASARTTLGLGSAATHAATDFDATGAAAAAQAASQPVDAELTALAALVSAADSLPYFTGSGAAALTTLSAFIRTLLDDADATTARATLGLGTLATKSAVASADITDGTIVDGDVAAANKDGAVGTASMRTLGPAAGQAASGADPLALGFASTAAAGSYPGNQGMGGPRGRYFRLRTGGTFTKIRIGVGTSTGNISVASYPNSGSNLSAKPGARAQTSGVVACPASGVGDVALGGSDTRVAGDWFCLSASGNPSFYASGGSANWPDAMGAGEAYDVFGDDPAPTNPAPSNGLVGLVYLMKGVP